MVIFLKLKKVLAVIITVLMFDIPTVMPSRAAVDISEQPLYSTDFANTDDFYKYFLGLIDTEGLPDVRKYKEAGEYEEAAEAYRNAVLSQMRTSSMTGSESILFASGYYGQYADYLAGFTTKEEFLEKNPAGDIVLLVNAGFDGDPEQALSPDWSIENYSAQGTDYYYFYSFDGLISRYVNTRNEVYMKKWFQITNTFCREQKRWVMDNIGAESIDFRCAWYWKNAYSCLVQANRMKTIIRGLGIFAKCAEGSYPKWNNYYAAIEDVSDTDSYDIIDCESFINIAISLVYDHCEAMSKRYVDLSVTPNQRLDGLAALGMVRRYFSDFLLVKEYYSERTEKGLNNFINESYYPDGGMCEQAFNYNNGGIENGKLLYDMYAGCETEATKRLYEATVNAERLYSAVKFPDGKTPVVGMGSINAPGGYKNNFKSIAFPYAGYYMMRSGWDSGSKNMFMQSARRTTGHLYPSSNAVELYANGRLLLSNGGTPWYYPEQAPADQAAEYEKYNEYFGETSSFNRNTVIVDGFSQSKHEFNAVVGTCAAFGYTTGDKWYSDDNFDFVSSQYSGGYGSESKLNTSHTRQVLFIKSAGLYIVNDEVDGDKEQASQIWNFPPKLTSEQDGIDVDGFSDSEIIIQENTIKTASLDGANVFLYSFYPLPLEYKRYCGYKGDDGYRGFYANGFGRKYPKTDVHVNFRTGEYPLITLIDTSENEYTNIISKKDLSSKESGCSGFRAITVNGDKIEYYASNTANSYVLNGYAVTAKTAAIVNGKDIVVTGCTDGYKYQDFTAKLINNELTDICPILSPTDFEWVQTDNGLTPDYSYAKPPFISNVSVSGEVFRGNTLRLDYSCDIPGCDTIIQWYESVDNKHWNSISGADSNVYQVPYYFENKQTPKYYMAAVRPIADTAGNVAFSGKTTISAYFADDFESGKYGEIYNIGKYLTDKKSFCAKAETVTEGNNTFLRYRYGDYDESGGKGIGITQPYIRRFWNTFFQPVCLNIKFRLNGEAALIRPGLVNTCALMNIDYGGVSVYYTDEDGKKTSYKLTDGGENYKIEENVWYTVRAVINPTETEMYGMRGLSYYFSIKCGDGEWLTSDCMTLPDINDDKIRAMYLNNGSGQGQSRLLSQVGADDRYTASVIDIDDYSILPFLTVGTPKYHADGNCAGFEFEIKNHDTLNNRDCTVLIADYEKGCLRGVKVFNISLLPEESRMDIYSTAISSTSDIVKCFVWQSAGGGAVNPTVYSINF